MRVLAAIDTGSSAPAVMETAERLAGLLGADLDALRVVDASTVTGDGLSPRLAFGDPARVILDAAADDDVVLVALGAGHGARGDSGTGRVTRDVLTQCSKPVVVVPPRPVKPEPDRPPTVVVDLDGVGVRSPALGDVTGRLARGGANVVGLHVFGPDDAPVYWDHYYSDLLDWHQRFRRATPAAATMRLVLAWGSVATQALRTAVAEHAAFIVVAWMQDVASWRSGVVARILAASPVPVLLVPVAAAGTVRERPLVGASA